MRYLEKIVCVDGVACKYRELNGKFSSLSKYRQSKLGNSFENYCMRNNYLITSDEDYSILEYCWNNCLPALKGVKTTEQFKSYLDGQGIIYYDTIDAQQAVKGHHAIERVLARDGVLLVEVPQCSDLYYFRR